MITAGSNEQEGDFDRFVFGSWQLGGARKGPISNEEALGLVSAALARGVQAFDTANIYGNGRAEVLLGTALSTSKTVRIITKGGYVTGTDGAQDLLRVQPQDFRPSSLRRSLEESLVRLQRDYVDVYLLHDPSEEVVVDDVVWDQMRSFQSEGLVTQVGASTSPRKAALAIRHGAEIVEVLYNVARRDAEVDLFPVAVESGVSVLARSPFSGGPLLEFGSESSVKSPSLREMICFPLQNPAVSAVVVGVATLSELEQDLACLTSED